MAFFLISLASKAPRTCEQEEGVVGSWQWRVSRISAKARRHFALAIAFTFTDQREFGLG